MSAETSTVDLSQEGGAPADEAGAEETKSTTTTTKPLSDADAEDFCRWLEVTLGSTKVSKVKVTKRLSDSPAIVTDHESGALRRMMKMVVGFNIHFLVLYWLEHRIVFASVYVCVINIGPFAQQRVE